MTLRRLIAVTLAYLVAQCATSSSWAQVEAAAGPTAKQKQYVSFKPCQWPEADSAVQHLSELIQFHTVNDASHPDHADPVVWDLVDLWLKDTYSDVFAALKVEKVSFPTPCPDTGTVVC